MGGGGEGHLTGVHLTGVRKRIKTGAVLVAPVRILPVVAPVVPGVECRRARGSCEQGHEESRFAHFLHRHVDYEVSEACKTVRKAVKNIGHDDGLERGLARVP